MDPFLKRKSPSTDETDMDDLPYDPGERKETLEYHPNQRDEVRRKYLTREPCQPRGHSFKQRIIGNTPRRFYPSWFDQYGDWLKYSVKKEKAYCLCCYLFSNEKKGGNVGFMTEGFDCWNKFERLAGHVGVKNSFHNIAKKKCEDLMRQGESIKHAFHKQTNVMKNEYLLRQGLPFRGHDETIDSSNQGNFLELLKYTGERNEVVNKKDIVNCFSEEVVNSIIQEIDNDVFALLVDESADCSKKEHMVIVFFIDKHGIVKERFVGLVHVKEISSSSLKSGIDSLFAKYSLSLKKVRGQGYDGAGNMKGELNGLRTLISRESSSAYYVHCFAHQLQLVVVAVEKKHLEVENFFDKISVLVNVVVASFDLFSSVVKVLEYVQDEDVDNTQKKVKSTKRQLQKLRDDGWDSLVKKVLDFCEKHDTEILNMEDDFIDPRKPRKNSNMTNLHHYQVNCFYTVLDMQLHEFNDRFNEVNSELLVCTSGLNPSDSFSEFDKEKLLRFAELYPEDFSRVECISLEQQLDIYIDNVREDERFAGLRNIGDLARLMIETKKHLSHPLVYRLLKLTLTLPVATPTVERCFLGMKIVKTVLRNDIGDQFLSDCLICYIKKKNLKM
ncbi:hypothetical protein EUTSA_v10002288mg [Eutrema salsugineum]|uniref:TTF-type domain-containing protein n=1 Tax=Eutrema salsugineum TaxID=72664 RepID=V4M2K8_EUTSA|nr:hypothetical protein EUTSA_v10002288mg [Eutrema salsugineum]